MSLAEKLDALREAGGKRIGEEKRAVMRGATEDLRQSGILDGAAKVGDAFPSFALNNADGELVRSSDLLGRGAVVLTVFRGAW